MKNVNKNGMKRILNYYKSDQVALFELPEAWYGQDRYQESLISYSDLSDDLMADRVCHEFMQLIILVISVLILVFLSMTHIRVLKTLSG